MIAPGVPDVQALRMALEMGYELHSDGLWWPVYDKTQWDKQDMRSATWPNYIWNQWDRLGKKLYISPDGSRTKEIAL